MIDKDKIEKYIKENFSENINFEVVNNISQIPNIQKKLKDNNFDFDYFMLPFIEIKGMVSTTNKEKTIYIMSDFINDFCDLNNVILHEVLGHYVFSEIFNENEQQKILNKIYKTIPQDSINELVKSYGNIEKEQIADEYIAHIAENFNPSKKDNCYLFIKSLFLNIIEKIGFKDLKINNLNVDDILFNNKKFFKKNIVKIKKQNNKKNIYLH